MLKNIFSEIVKAELVTIFKVTVVWSMLLYSIVCQVYPIICQCSSICCVFGWTGADVTLTKEVAIEIVGNQNPHSNIKLTPMNKQRVLYVLLYNELVAFKQISLRLCRRMTLLLFRIWFLVIFLKLALIGWLIMMRIQCKVRIFIWVTRIIFLIFTMIIATFKFIWMISSLILTTKIVLKH